MNVLTTILGLLFLWVPFLHVASSPTNHIATGSQEQQQLIVGKLFFAGGHGSPPRTAYLYETGPEGCDEIWGSKEARPPLRGDSQVRGDLHGVGKCATYYGENCAEGTRIHEYQAPMSGRFEGMLITYRCWY